MNYSNLPVDDRHLLLSQEHEACVKIRTDLTTPQGLLPRMCKWLETNVHSWKAASMHDGTLDIMVYINTQRHAALFALTWSEYVSE